MAKGFKTGSGGINLLNFDVIGGTEEPSYSRMNAIWIDTDVLINGWIFSATEPSEPVEGMVWILIGLNAAIQFNALRKNGIMISPLAARQYIGGTWTEKTARTSQNGQWQVLVPPLQLIPNVAEYPADKWNASDSNISIKVSDGQAVVSFFNDGEKETFSVLVEVDATNYTTMKLKGTATVTAGLSSTVNIRAGLFKAEVMMAGYYGGLLNGESDDISGTYDISAITGTVWFAFTFQVSTTSSYRANIVVNDVTFC